MVSAYTGISIDEETSFYFTVAYNCTGSDDLNQCNSVISFNTICSSVRFNCSGIVECFVSRVGLSTL